MVIKVSRIIYNNVSVIFNQFCCFWGIIYLPDSQENWTRLKHFSFFFLFLFANSQVTSLFCRGLAYGRSCWHYTEYKYSGHSKEHSTDISNTDVCGLWSGGMFYVTGHTNLKKCAGCHNSKISKELPLLWMHHNCF